MSLPAVDSPSACVQRLTFTTNIKFGHTYNRYLSLDLRMVFLHLNIKGFILLQQILTMNEKKHNESGCLYKASYTIRDIQLYILNSVS